MQRNEVVMVFLSTDTSFHDVHEVIFNMPSKVLAPEISLYNRGLLNLSLSRIQTQLYLKDGGFNKSLKMEAIVADI